MIVMSALLYGEDLGPDTVHLYLRDPTFVEYFNSFLLLPAFSSSVFYNVDTGYFEQVHSEGVRGWREEGVTPSTSVDTLYLMDDDVGPSMDSQQCWSWVVQHRLPLFLHSDLYSEYKLCKLLISNTSPGNDISQTETFVSYQPRPSSPHTPRSSALTHTNSTKLLENPSCVQPTVDIPSPLLPSLFPAGTNDPRGGSLSTLPHLLTGIMSVSASTPQQSTRPSIAASRSNIELGSDRGRGSRPGGGKKRQKGLKRSLSLDFAATASTLHEWREDEAGQEVEGSLCKLRAEDYGFIGTKSGMSGFWRFLRGKAGERNWLFWLDAERVRYYGKPIDQKRLLRDLRERYLHAGSPMELPSVVRRRLGLSKASRITLEQLRELQHLLAQGLREYWCPRFILNCRGRTKHRSSSSPSQRPLSRSYSSAPFTLTSSPPSTTPHPHPLASIQTPTFRRHGGRPRPRSSPTGHQKRQMRQTSSQEPEDGQEVSFTSPNPKRMQTVVLAGDMSIPKVCTDERILGGMNYLGITGPDYVAIGRPRPHTAPELDLHGLTTRVKDGTSTPSGGTSRKVWSSTTVPTPLPSRELPSELSQGGGGGMRRGKERRSREKEAVSSAALYSQLAKYTQRHLPDANSRCASAMDSHQDMCESHCQILSVSGTPIHHPSTPLHLVEGVQGGQDYYSIFLRCLGMEQWKAGRYFQEHLEKMQDKMYLHCLLFWRDVQEYKSLFLRPSFSPCAVEMKAKTLHGRFITESSDESICCPPLIAGQILNNLFPPYEDLFDGAEEYVLGILFGQWAELRSSEERIFEQVGVVPLSKLWPDKKEGEGRGMMDDLEELDEEDDDQADGSLPYTSPRFSPSPTKCSPRASLTASRSQTSRLHTPNLSSYPSISPSRAATPSQAQSRATSLNDIINNPTELEHFKIFLNENYAAQDLMFWMEIEAFRGIPASQRHLRDVSAKHLRSKYFSRKYYFGPSSPASKEAQRQTVLAGGGGYGSRLPSRPKTPVFREAQKHVRARLEKKWVTVFITTPEFLERNRSSIINGKGGTKADGLSQAPVYEKTFSSSHEALLLRKALQDEESRTRFLRYLMVNRSSSRSGTQFPRQDTEFWLEVQRYKVMCHAHTTEQTLQAKVSAIIECYFQSQVPPKVQLDISQTIAGQVISKCLGPYVFREAQASVFKQLYLQWQGYQNFISGYSAVSEIDQALSDLSGQIKHLQSTAKFREAHEKMEEERKKVSVPRFETLQEKIERKKREKELAEFGEAAVAFRLSTPNPSYKYYTEIPGREREEGEEEDGEKATSSAKDRMDRKWCWEEPVATKRVRKRHKKTSYNEKVSVSLPQPTHDPTALPSNSGGRIRRQSPNKVTSSACQ